MSKNKRRIADLLFGVQLVGMATFIGGQFLRMTESVQGISPMWLICAWVFCIINAGLAYHGWRHTPGRATFQLLVTHGGWSVLLIPLLVLFAMKRSEVVWGWYDTATGVLVVVGTIVTVAIGRRHQLGISDPIVRGILAGFYRGVPHVTLAYKIYLLGGTGLAALAVWAAHVTSCVRFLQLISVVYTAGWDRARRGLLLAETINIATWILVTVIWLAF